MNAWPRITLITPSFNQGRYLEETITSVLDQGYPNLEYIVVDGGSSDESASVIRRHARHLAWWVSEKDRGQAHALNKGFARATGEIFGYINSDDYLMPGALHAVAEAVADGTQWVIGGVKNFAEDGEIYEQHYTLHDADADKWHWLVANPLHQPGSFWSARMHQLWGPFDETLRYTFDYAFFIRMRLLGDISPRKVPAMLAAFRLHEASKTVAEGSKFEAEFARVRREILSRLAPREREAAARYASWRRAMDLQIEALRAYTGGRRMDALDVWWRSVRECPRIVWERQTAGCLRRILTPGRVEGVRP